MNGIRNRKKKRFWKPAAAVFFTLYLATMGLATLLVKQKFEDEYIRMSGRWRWRKRAGISPTPWRMN